MFALSNATRHATRGNGSRAIHPVALLKPHIFRSLSRVPPTADDKKDADMNYVKITMEKWVQSYIVEHELCPFAKKSDYRIVVWPEESVGSVHHELLCDFKEAVDSYDPQILLKIWAETKAKGWQAKGPVDDTVGIVNFMKTETKHLMNRSTKRPNTLVIFPFVEEFLLSIGMFEMFNMYIASSIPGVGTILDYDDPSCNIQMFLFHIDNNFRFKTPWPMLHLLRKDDLDRLRRGSDGVSTAINKKNNLTLASDDVKRKLAKILLDGATFPDPIVLTKSICPEQKARLHAEGISVVEAQCPMSKNDDGADKRVTIKKRSNRRNGKRKKKW